MHKFLVADVFAIVYMIGLAITYRTESSANRASLLFIGIIFAALCIYTFFFAGSRHILFSSIFSYGQLLFIACPAILIGIGYINLRTDLRSSVALLFLSICFFLQVLVFGCSQTIPKLRLTMMDVPGSYQVLALGFSIIAFAASYGGSTSTLLTQIGYLSLVALILSSIVTFSRPTLRRSLPHAACLTAITGMYVVYQFSGFGRLVLASYLLSICVVFSWMTSTYIPKIVTMVATVPSLIILALSRIAFIQESQNRQIGTDEGISSVFGPFQSGAYILQSAIDGSISPTHGQSLLTSVLFWVPRTVWAEKPEGFGRAIVPVTQPHLISAIGYSDAAPYLAEYVWDFGVLGLILGLFLTLFLCKSDRWIGSYIFSQQLNSTSSRSVLLFTSLVAFVSMFLNYIWGGSFSYLSRTLVPALMLLGLYFLSRRTLTQRRERQQEITRYKMAKAERFSGP